MTNNQKNKANIWLITMGIIMLLYAILGNYIALPGYVRFLERGGRSASGNIFDLSVLIGAVKTIMWMYSFQLGVLLLSIAYSIRERLHTKWIIILGVLWLALWSWPKIPAPGHWFYIFFGSIIMVFIVLVFVYPKQLTNSQLNKTLFLGSIIFFSFATWEVCGLGSTGRMLHPDQSSTPLALNLLITQSTKLMFEFVLAWGLLLSSRLVRQRSE
jgi:hypothetical protein